MDVLTCLNNVLEIPQDSFDFGSLLRFLVPALLCDLPDRRSHSRGFKVTRFWWPFILKEQNNDAVLRGFGEGHLSGHELETKTIGTWACHTFGKHAYLHNDHRQGIHIRLICRFSLLDPYAPFEVKKFGRTVAHRVAVVWC